MLLRLSHSLRGAWRRRHGEYSQMSGQAEKRPEHLFLRAKALLRMGDRTMAIRLLQDAAALDPGFTDAIEGEGEVLDLNGNIKAAQEKYTLARQIREKVQPGAPDRHYVLRRRGPTAADILAYSSVIKSLRKYALPYLARGNAYLVGGQSELALADYERALRLQPGLLDALALKGEALSAMGRFREAEDFFDRVLAARPKDVDALNARGIARMATGRVNDANTDWRLQYDLTEHRPTARACLAMRLADYSLALPNLQAAVGTNKSAPCWTLYRDTALIRLGAELPAEDIKADDTWPAALQALLRGTLGAEDLRSKADTASRRAELSFQLGVLACRSDAVAARQHWQTVADEAPPHLIEYAAARNELLRLDS
jgi:tetratricopeptide (TPR) repeat protein